METYRVSTNTGNKIEYTSRNSVFGSTFIKESGLSHSLSHSINHEILDERLRNKTIPVNSYSINITPTIVKKTNEQLESTSSEVEYKIINSANQIDFDDSESLTVHGNTGIWLNKNEIWNWKGDIPITEYSINEDSNPEIIRKQTDQKILCKQEVAVRYLRPPTPPPPGEIIIREEKNFLTAPAPPLVIRQVPPRPETPVPLILREVPPKQPVIVGKKIITISGKRLPPPPRKVVIERLAQLPKKPQAVIVERWLPYTQSKRKVIFQKNTVADPVIVKPRNVIIQWDTPTVEIKKDFKDLGIIRADPMAYAERYGSSLKSFSELPQFVKEIRPPMGVILASEYVGSGIYDLEGDIEALKLIDLEKEGLIEYKSYVEKVSSSYSYSTTSSSTNRVSAGKSIVNSILQELFESIDTDSSGKISRSEAESLLLRLYSRLGKNYCQSEAVEFVRLFDINFDGMISFEEFKNGLIRNFSSTQNHGILDSILEDTFQ
jgi:Ca2+-binding EF-hand superfamily protein